MDSVLNNDVAVAILSCAQNGVTLSNSKSSDVIIPIELSSAIETLSNLLTSSLGNRNLDITSEFRTPSDPSHVLKKGNQGEDYLFNTQPLNKKATYNDLTNTLEKMMIKFISLELKVNQLENDYIMLRNQVINTDSRQINENISKLNILIIELIKIKKLQNPFMILLPS